MSYISIKKLKAEVMANYYIFYLELKSLKNSRETKTEMSQSSVYLFTTMTLAFTVEQILPF